MKHDSREFSMNELILRLSSEKLHSSILLVLSLLVLSVDIVLKRWKLALCGKSATLISSWMNLQNEGRWKRCWGDNFAIARHEAIQLIKFYMSNFQEKNEISQYWINRAFDLKWSAWVIWLGIKNNIELTELWFQKWFDTRISCFNSFVMLFWLSLELLLKGIIVRNWWIPPSSHKLKNLSEIAKIDYDKSDIELLNLLSEWIVWYGKYPTPTKEDEYNKFREISKEYFWEKKGIFFIKKRQLGWSECEYLWKKAFSSLLDKE